jgi:hypothetical protein
MARLVIKTAWTMATIADRHDHAINPPLFRGIVDDLPPGAIGKSKVRSMLMTVAKRRPR